MALRGHAWPRRAMAPQRLAHLYLFNANLGINRASTHPYTLVMQLASCHEHFIYRYVWMTFLVSHTNIESTFCMSRPKTHLEFPNPKLPSSLESSSDPLKRYLSRHFHLKDTSRLSSLIEILLHQRLILDTSYIHLHFIF